MEWFEELGFDANPFDTSPAFSAKFSVGLEAPLSELEYYVSSGSLVFVEGAPGSGKSVLLNALAGKLGSKAVCVDCFAGEVGLRSIIRRKASFIDRLLGRVPKGIALLVDNAGGNAAESVAEPVAKPGLSANAMALLKYYYDNNHLGSVVFFGASFKSAGLSPAIVDRIGSRIVRLPVLGEEDAVLLVRRRLGPIGSFGSSDLLGSILSGDVIRRIYRMSGKNTKRFLQLCENACKAALASKGDLNG